MENTRFVSTDDFNSYSKYLAEEIKALKESLTALNSSESTNEEIKNLKEYSSYIAEKLNQAIAYSEHVAEKADQAIAYSEHVAEKADQGIQYSEHVAEKLDQSIQYSEHIAEGVEAIKGYTNYLAESYNEGVMTHENVVKYVNYLKENLEKVTEYAEYVAETVNSNLLMEDDTDAGKELTEEPNDKTPEVIDAEGEKYPKAEDAAEDIEDELEKDIEASKADGENTGKEVTETEDKMDAYKKEVAEKLASLVESAKAKSVAEPHFFKFIAEAKKGEFNTLSLEEKTVVAKAIEGKGFLTESQIYALWNNALAPVQQAEPLVISAMPTEYKETWNSLSESKKNQLLAQSKYHRLETEYQVRNFWQTRDLREVAQVIERVEMVKESTEEAKQLPYDMTGVAESLNKRFKK
jgi:hypothetical protein